MRYCLVFFLLLSLTTSVSALQFDVSVTDDRADVVVGDGICGLPDSVVGGPWCSLRAAVQEANATAGKDTIVLATEIYTLTLGAGEADDNIAAVGDLNVFEDLEIQGNGATIDGGQLIRVFEVAAVELRLSNLTIERAYSATDGAGIFAIRSSLILDGVSFKNNRAENDGAGIFLAGGSLTVSNGRFDENAAGQAGGALAIDEADLVIDGVVFYGNEAEDGGAVYLAAIQSLDVVSTDFWTNTAMRFGGAVMIEGFSRPDGEAFDGQAIANEILTLRQVRFGANEAVSGSGGGLYVEHLLSAVNEARLLVSDCLFQDNIGFHGGGIAVYHGRVIVERCTFDNNFADSLHGEGGAVFSRSLLDINGSTFTGNRAEVGSGAIAAEGDLYFINSNASGNHSFGPDETDEGIQVLGALLIERDADADGIDDAEDNCRGVANPAQTNVGGLDGIADLIGDDCQCGDVNDDGNVDDADTLAISQFDTGQRSDINLLRCDVSGDDRCDNLDADLISYALLTRSVGLQQCDAASLDPGDGDPTNDDRPHLVLPSILLLLE
ncbi:MAG: hypothetical protein GY703_02095 [Gammaproteobacteria bacterium]|nr:hypothetical protein [Gammaproteobacteria bacterium]